MVKTQFFSTIGLNGNDFSWDGLYEDRLKMMRIIFRSCSFQTKLQYYELTTNRLPLPTNDASDFMITDV